MFFNIEPAQPTLRCPNQWATVGSGDRANCAPFWNCVDGTEHSFTCPKGLAFSSLSHRCEWPDQVAECDVQGK